MSLFQRDQVLQKASKQTWDLVIVGGGIGGAGVARLASSFGFKTLLVEQKDFSCGTSSRSSKMLHGGLRYLESFEFDLVLEALADRNKLLEAAPNLTSTKDFLLPVYTDSRTSLGTLIAGVWLYDALSFFESENLHSSYPSFNLSKMLPSLKKDKLVGGVSYMDGLMDDGALTTEEIRTAVKQGASALNYVKAAEIKKSEDGKYTVLCEDQLEGENSFEVQARKILVTVGPWLRDGFGLSGSKKNSQQLQTAKGIHLVIPRKFYPYDKAMVIPEDEKKRIMFVIPRDGQVLLGTTDTFYKGSLSDVDVDQESIDQVLELFNHFFPDKQLKTSDIISSYAGVRPLIKDGASAESEISRREKIWSDQGVFFLGGGKYTTYRSVSQKVLDHILESLSFEERLQRRRDQKLEDLEPVNPDVGDKASYELLLEQHKLSPHLNLIKRFGAEFFKFQNDFFKPQDQFADLGFAARFSIHQASCLLLTDFYLYRHIPFFFGADNSKEKLLFLADVFQKELGWSDQLKGQQIQEVLSLKSFQISD